jgi:hypothetical protein
VDTGWQFRSVCSFEQIDLSCQSTEEIILDAADDPIDHIRMFSER